MKSKTLLIGFVPWPKERFHMNTKQLAALLLPACMALGSHTVSAGVHGGSANIDDVISGTASDPSDGVGPNVVLDVEGDDGEAVIGEAKLVAVPRKGMLKRRLAR